ncbi:MAG: hypothetical protein ACK4HV_03200 [Parachlamydiaceae bacterium]
MSLDDLNKTIENEGFSFKLEAPKPVVAIPLYNTQNESPHTIHDWFLRQLEIK